MRAKLMKPEAMIFDLDGTLFETESLLIPAYNQTFEQLRAEGLYEGETPPVERILEVLGMLLSEIWEHVMPSSSDVARNRANELLLQNQIKGLQQGVGNLYPQVKETLTSLQQQGVRLFVASNGLEGYVKGVAEYLGIAPLFQGVYSAGEYETESKVKLVRLLLEDHQVESAWMVGDRSSDVEAGKENGLVVIGCNYGGFAESDELKGSDYVVDRFEEIVELL